MARLADLQALHLDAAHVFAPIATSVEVHVSAMVGRLVVLSNIDDTPFGAELLTAAERDLTRTWHDRYRWLNRGFGVVVTGKAPAQRFDTVVEIRNSIIHGDGQFSDDQQALPLAKLVALKGNMKKHLHVTADGRLRFAADTVDLAFTTARAFIVHLDTAVLAAYPAAKTL